MISKNFRLSFYFLIITALLVSIFVCTSTKERAPEPETKKESVRSSSHGKMKFSEEIQLHHPDIWKIYKKYEDGLRLDCEEFDGNYRCEVEENMQLFYDSKNGHFGVKMILK